MPDSRQPVSLRVKETFQDHSIQHVFMGAGLELEQRLEIVRTVFQSSESTTVHMKDFGSGSRGFFPFVRRGSGSIGAHRRITVVPRYGAALGSACAGGSVLPE